MKIVKEFKDFASKGNVVDMAIGIIIGAAFGKIVSSLVADVIMPPIGLLIGGVTFTDIVIPLRDAFKDPVTGKMTAAVVLKLGSFLQTLFDFILIALSVFLLLKAMMKVNKKKEEVKPPSKEEILLAEIRDILKSQNVTN